MWSSGTPITDDIIAMLRPLVSVNDLIRGSMRAVRGVWDSGATIVHWVVELEAGIVWVWYLHFLCDICV